MNVGALLNTAVGSMKGQEALPVPQKIIQLWRVVLTGDGYRTQPSYRLRLPQIYESSYSGRFSKPQSVDGSTLPQLAADPSLAASFSPDEIVRAALAYAENQSLRGHDLNHLSGALSAILVTQRGCSVDLLRPGQFHTDTGEES